MDTDAEANRLFVELLRRADGPYGPKRCLMGRELRRYPFEAGEILHSLGLLVARPWRYATPQPRLTPQELQYLADEEGRLQDICWKLTWWEQYPEASDEIRAGLGTGCPASSLHSGGDGLYWELGLRALIEQLANAYPWWAVPAQVRIPDVLWRIGDCRSAEPFSIFLARGLTNSEVRSLVLRDNQLRACSAPLVLTPWPEPPDSWGNGWLKVAPVCHFLEVREGRLQPPSRVCQEPDAQDAASGPVPYSESSGDAVQGTAAPADPPPPAPIEDHDAKYEWVKWRGRTFNFRSRRSQRRRIAMKLLHEAHKKGERLKTTDFVSAFTSALHNGETTDSCPCSMCDLFRDHPAWGTLILTNSHGEYWLNCPTETPAD